MEFVALSTVWWVLAGAAVIAELLTGTFYLLMMAIGLIAGAVAAHIGFEAPAQMGVAALLGAGSVIAWHYYRRHAHPVGLPATSNPDVNMDVGETVQVDEWLPDGTANVRYRGAQWTVLHRPGNNPVPGAHRVTEIVGSRLLVDKI